MPSSISRMEIGGRRAGAPNMPFHPWVVPTIAWKNTSPSTVSKNSTRCPGLMPSLRTRRPAAALSRSPRRWLRTWASHCSADRASISRLARHPHPSSRTRPFCCIASGGQRRFTRTEPRPELAPRELVAVRAAALDGGGREIAQAVLVVGRILLGLSAGQGRMLGVLHVEVEDLDALEAVGAVDAALQVAGDRALRSERRELADRADEVVDAVRAVVVLAQAVAEGELVDPVLNLGEVLRQAGAERIEVHDDEAPVGVRIVREGVDGVAERRVVDEAAVPIRRAADLDPRKLRRQASARQDMPGLDRADMVGFALRRRPVLALS